MLLEINNQELKSYCIYGTTGPVFIVTAGSNKDALNIVFYLICGLKFFNPIKKNLPISKSPLPNAQIISHTLRIATFCCLVDMHS